MLSIKECLFNLLNVTGGSVQPFERWLNLKEIFDSCIKVKMIKNFGFLDITDFLTASRDIFCEKPNLIHESVKVYGKIEDFFHQQKWIELLRTTSPLYHMYFRFISILIRLIYIKQK